MPEWRVATLSRIISVSRPMSAIRARRSARRTAPERRWILRAQPWPDRSWEGWCSFMAGSGGAGVGASGDRAVLGGAVGQGLFDHGGDELAFGAHQRHARQAHMLGAHADQGVDELEVLHQLF